MSGEWCVRGVQVHLSTAKKVVDILGYPIAPTPPLQSGEGGRSKIASCSVIIALPLPGIHLVARGVNLRIPNSRVKHMANY